MRRTWFKKKMSILICSLPSLNLRFLHFYCFLSGHCYIPAYGIFENHHGKIENIAG